MQSLFLKMWKIFVSLLDIGDLIADCFTCQENGHWKGWERSRADTVAGFLTNMTIEEGEKYDKYDDRWRRGRRPARSLTGLSASRTSPWQSFVIGKDPFSFPAEIFKPMQ